MSIENVCYGCKKEFEGTITTAFEEEWHPSCFTCIKCKTQLTGSFYAVEDTDKKGACPECHKNADLCEKCKKPIFLGFMTAINRKWHHKCLVCVNCKGSLVSEQIFNVHENPVCPKCIHIFQLKV